jgi:alpha-1,2-mannosyltransferase
MLGTRPFSQEKPAVCVAPELRSGLLRPGIVAAVVAIAALALDVLASHNWSMIDLRVYHWAGWTAWQHPYIYDLQYEHFLKFTYTPMALAIFMVAAVIPITAQIVAITIATLVSLGLSVWLALGIAGYQRGPGRLGLSLLISAVALWLEPIQQTLGFGQVNAVLMVVVLADLSLPGTSRWQGAGIGLAAGFKLVPGIFILYLLVTRRLRAAAVAGVTLAATVLGGFLVLPAASRQYWLGGLFAHPDRAGPTDYVANQSLDGLLSRILRTTVHGARPLWLLAAAIAAIIGLALASWAHRQGRVLLGVAATALTGLLISPISWSHHWVWIAVFGVAGVDLALRHRSRTGWLLTTALAALFFAYPVKEPHHPVLPQGLIWTVPFRSNLEWTWHGLQIVTGNLYVMTGAALLLALTGYLAASHPLPRSQCTLMDHRLREAGRQGRPNRRGRPGRRPLWAGDHLPLPISNPELLHRQLRVYRRSLTGHPQDKMPGRRSRHLIRVKWMRTVRRADCRAQILLFCASQLMNTDGLWPRQNGGSARGFFTDFASLAAR